MAAAVRPCLGWTDGFITVTPKRNKHDQTQPDLEPTKGEVERADDGHRSVGPAVPRRGLSEMVSRQVERPRELTDVIPCDRFDDKRDLVLCM